MGPTINYVYTEGDRCVCVGGGGGGGSSLLFISIAFYLQKGGGVRIACEKRT